MQDQSLEQWKFNANYRLDDREKNRNALENLKNMFKEPLRMFPDDRYYLRFLRYNKLNVKKAYDMMMAIYRERLTRPDVLPSRVGPLDFKKFYDLECVELLKYRNPKDGCPVLIVRAGQWTPDFGMGCLASCNAMMFIVELLLDDERSQTLGTQIIVDLQGFPLSWILKFCPPTTIPRLLNGVQSMIPMKYAAIHVLHQPSMYNVIFTLASPFLSLKNRKKIYLHGSDIERIHEFIDPSILPDDLLGKQKKDFKWFTDILYSRHAAFSDQYFLNEDSGNKTSQSEL